MRWWNSIEKKLKAKLPGAEKAVSAAPLAVILAYLYGVFLHTVKAGIAATFSTAPRTEPIMDWSPFTAIGTVLSPFGAVFTLALAAMVFLFSGKCREWLSNEKIEHDRRGFDILDDGLHGTSGWMDEKERETILQIGPVEKLTDAPLGKLDQGAGRFVAIKETAYMSGHTIVYGASGSGKTRGLTLPLLMKKITAGAVGNESLIVVDPKGDLFERTSKLARDNGFEVRALNLMDLDHSDGFNCFDAVEADASLVSIIAEAIIATTSNKLERADFWAKAEKNLLMALILYVASLRSPMTGELLPIHERHLGEIYKILSSESITEIDNRFAQLPAGHPAQAPYGIFKLANHTIWGNIAVGLGNRLSVFQDPRVDRITRYNNIDLTLPGKRPCVYYCIISDHDNSMEFLSSMFFSLMFTRLMAAARREGTAGKLPVRVNMILEEFCNIYLAGASRLLSVVRSRNIACILITQGIAQLSGRYPQREWEEIISNCSVQLVLGVNDMMTAEYCSKKCGVVTVKTDAQMSPQLPMFSFLNGAGANARYSHTRSEAQRPLMFPDEITRMDKRRCLALIGGHKPLFLWKLTPEEIPGFTQLQPTRIMDYIPLWQPLEEQRQTVQAPPRRQAPLPAETAMEARQMEFTVPAEKETYHYELTGEAEPPQPAERVGNMRRYTGTLTARDVMARTGRSRPATTGTAAHDTTGTLP